MGMTKTSELTGDALDWAVEKCQPLPDHGQRSVEDGYHPSTDWAQGGPIIERERIQLRGSFPEEPPDWTASLWCNNTTIFEDAPTPLVAAMRCYVASKLGDTIELPEELK